MLQLTISSKKKHLYYQSKLRYIRGGFRGRERGGGKPSPTSGIRPPADPKGPPFGTF